MMSLTTVHILYGPYIYWDSCLDFQKANRSIEDNEMRETVNFTI